jgi:hypothetical protein
MAEASAIVAAVSVPSSKRRMTDGGLDGAIDQLAQNRGSTRFRC